jgi:hypothetical protein
MPSVDVADLSIPDGVPADTRRVLQTTIDGIKQMKAQGVPEPTIQASIDAYQRAVAQYMESPGEPSLPDTPRVDVADLSVPDGVPADRRRALQNAIDGIKQMEAQGVPEQTIQASIDAYQRAVAQYEVGSPSNSNRPTSGMKTPGEVRALATELSRVETKEACEALSGSWWERHSRMTPKRTSNMTCSLATSDGGKPCSSSTDCESHNCQSSPRVKAGDDAKGKCVGWIGANPKQPDCSQKVEGGVARGRWKVVSHEG